MILGTSVTRISPSVVPGSIDFFEGDCAKQYLDFFGAVLTFFCLCVKITQSSESVFQLLFVVAPPYGEKKE